MITGLFSYAYIPKDSVGQKIIAGKRCIVYKIEQGNTVSGLAQKYGTSLAAIKEVNPDTDLDKLNIGQILNIPRGNSSQNTANNVVKTPSYPVYYTVKSGDTPGGIAQKHGVPLQKLYTWNGFTQTPILQIGQKLIVGYSDGQGNVSLNTNNNNNTTITPVNPTFDNPNPQIKVVAQDETGKKDVVNEVFVKPYQKKIETGKILVTDSLLKPDTFGAIHKDLKTGTIVTITNPVNKKSVYARIEANDPKLTDYLLKVTPAIAEMLKSSEKEFNVEIKYVQ
jgi:LysM repeat protein